jgi:FMN-dependent oxidoreductase (nitrilotriacetate monooxygenase family)
MVQARRLTLAVGINSPGYSAAGWKYRTGSVADLANPAHALHLARIAHRGVFDAVFVSDMPLLRLGPDARPGQSIDPLILATAITAQVPDIGFVATVSSTFNSPYNLARRAQSVDLVSGGRLAINIVSNFVPEVAANFGSDPLPPRDVRYPRAIEFVDVLKKLWGSWDRSLEGPLPEGRFWDSAAADTIDHHGQFFDVRGPLNVPRGPQGHPVIAQAGASDGGIDLAARHGEILYTNVLSRGAGQALRRKVSARALFHGRDPGDIRIVPGLVPIIADSREEALRLHELYTGAGSEEGLIARFIEAQSLDPHGFDPDAVLDPERFVPDSNRVQALGFTLGLVELLRDEPLTARQVVRRAEGNHRLVLGTAEDVAEQIIDLWADGTVDGYVVQPPRAPDDIALFVDKVIPILQDRGVYPRAYEGATLRDRYGLRYPA